MEKNNSTPRHVAIIMDGNGRWAERKGYERVEGHRMGALAVKNLVDSIQNTGIEYLTLYAFSTENWKRSKEEVDSLMELLCEFIDANMEIIRKKGMRFRVTGRIGGLPEKARNKLLSAIGETKENRNKTLVLALNYGGRSEIADAAKSIAFDVKEGKLHPEEIDEQLFSRYLYLPDLPDPDLLIRTSGEMRLSNFLLWELSYSEIYVTDTLWPDFDFSELNKAIENYSKRIRRFGGR